MLKCSRQRSTYNDDSPPGLLSGGWSFWAMANAGGAARRKGTKEAGQNKATPTATATATLVKAATFAIHNNTANLAFEKPRPGKILQKTHSAEIFTWPLFSGRETAHPQGFSSSDLCYLQHVRMLYVTFHAASQPQQHCCTDAASFLYVHA